MLEKMDGKVHVENMPCFRKQLLTRRIDSSKGSEMSDCSSLESFAKFRAQCPEAASKTGRMVEILCHHCSKDTDIDYLATSSAMVALSFPTFWFGLMAIFIFADKLGILPSGGMYTLGGGGGLLDRLVHLILPTCVLGLVLVTGIVPRLALVFGLALEWVPGLAILFVTGRVFVLALVVDSVCLAV